MLRLAGELIVIAYGAIATFILLRSGPNASLVRSTFEARFGHLIAIGVTAAVGASAVAEGADSLGTAFLDGAIFATAGTAVATAMGCRGPRMVKASTLTASLVAVVPPVLLALS